MKFLSSKKLITLHATNASCALLLTLCASASYAQSSQIPSHLLAKEISPDVSRTMKKVLSDPSEPCGLEGAHEKHAHENKIRSMVLKQDAATTTDSARKLIFSAGELTLHQISTLVETLGELNSADTDKLLRSVYEYAEPLAARIKLDIEDAATRQAVANSNRDDIKIAVVAALEKNKSKNLNDLLSKSASGQGHLASRSQAVLKSQGR